MKIRSNAKGFTLLELLVVVLIIGILAGIALPQYQRAKEKSIMTEGIQLAKQIAEANQRYYLVNDKYADDIRDLDIEFSGEVKLLSSAYRIETNNFILSSKSEAPQFIAIVQKKPYITKYYIGITKEDVNSFLCYAYNEATEIQKELCNKLNTDGHL